MASIQTLHKYYYGEMKLPKTFAVHRSGRNKHKCMWLLHLTTNFWSIRFTFWHRWVGGVSFAYQHPSWIPGWAKFGILNEFRFYKPKPSLADGDLIPQLYGFTRWSNVVLDRDLNIG